MLGSLDSREISEWMAFFKIQNEELTKATKKQSAELPLDDKIKGQFPTKAGVKAGRR